MTEVEHLDVLIVGAGLSGIDAAHHVRTSCPWASYAVVEARGTLGGTWDLFRYPGIRSDSDMFTLGYPWRPWSGGESIADGPEILRYLRDTAAEEGIDRHIRYHHRIVRADWSSRDARWSVTVERGDPDAGPVETVELTCSWLYSCTGYYRYDRGYLPDFDGMTDFRGTIVHPQGWPEGLDYADKRVVVIGSGATAITLVPAMAPDAAHVTMLQRSPTYVASLPRTNPLTGLLRRITPRRFEGTVLKWTNVSFTQAFYTLSRRRPDLVKRVLRKRVAAQLPAGYDVERHFSPSYDPWDQRLCVVTDGDLFARIRDGSVDVVTDQIERFTPAGLRLRSGAEIPADVIVTATGLDLLFLGGIELTVDGEKVDPSERLAYKGMMLEGVPNLSMAVGYTNASWTLKADLTAQYTCRVLDRLRRTRATTCTPINREPGVEQQPLLGLSSGYVVRSADRFPKQGSRFPWQMYQSYFADHRVLRRGGFDDALEFTGDGTATDVAAAAHR
jgi:monooxygenase